MDTMTIIIELLVTKHSWLHLHQYNNNYCKTINVSGYFSVFALRSKLAAIKFGVLNVIECNHSDWVLIIISEY